MADAAAERAHKVINQQNKDVMVGIIGGTGLDDPDLLKDRAEVKMNTPYGEPSDVLITGTIGGVKCALLARHGRKHTIMPTNVNYRANLFAMKELGCTHVVVSTACGSLREQYKPGHIIVIDQFIDRTTKRPSTFFDGEPGHVAGVLHTEMCHPFDDGTRSLMIETLEDLKIPHHTKGTMVSIEGPRFSTRAESHMFRSWGADLINMTTCPEALLAKELGLLYGAFAMSTDYDAWREGEESVTVAAVIAVVKKNSANATKAILSVIPKIAARDWSAEIKALHDARFVMGV
mmetsp:Transcript_36596/g.95832  ORF Transcript_36596/g.95832 Transcript_36596/m.95832 type:complete len:290 (-) Transcript_36596:111-980(-)